MKKLKKIILISSFIILIIIFIIIISKDKKNNMENNQLMEGNDKISIVYTKEVSNPHMYFTVKRCIEKYMVYLYQKDKESVYRILNKEYIKKFNILQENVFEFVENVNSPVKLSIDKMYFMQKDENHHQYYIIGNISKNIMDQTVNEQEKICITIDLNLEDMIYSITPYGYGGPLYER